jgi:transposase
MALLPAPPPRPRGGVPRRVPDRACVAALVFMARTSTPWALLPSKELGCGSATTCWRRLDEWARAGVFEQLQAVLLDELGEAGNVDLPATVASYRPVDWGGWSGLERPRPTTLPARRSASALTPASEAATVCSQRRATISHQRSPTRHRSAPISPW